MLLEVKGEDFSLPEISNGQLLGDFWKRRRLFWEVNEPFKFWSDLQIFYKFRLARLRIWEYLALKPRPTNHETEKPSFALINRHPACHISGCCHEIQIPPLAHACFERMVLRLCMRVRSTGDSAIGGPTADAHHRSAGREQRQN
jgi:hypothetical protein